MASSKKGRLSVILISIGAAFILLAAAYGIYVMVSANNAVADNEKIIKLAEESMPPIREAFPEERGNNTMPAAELNGVNVAGIIELPDYGAKLPLRSSWDANAVKGIPCRYDGSVYNRTLMIGAVDGAGQFDFAAEMSVEDKLFLTDMSGGRYSYTVESIKHSTSFDADKWQAEEYDLTVFVKNSFTGEYTVIYLTAK